MNRQKLTAVKSIGLILIFLFSGCSSGSSAPEAELWGEWIVENIQSEKSDFAGSLIFHEDGCLVLDGQEEDPAQYVVIAPGRMKIIQGEEAEVYNFEVSEGQLKVYFEEGYNLYARQEEMYAAQTTRDDRFESPDSSTPGQKENLEEFVEDIFSSSQIISAKNVNAMAELRKLELNGLQQVIWSPNSKEIVVRTRAEIQLYNAENLSPKEQWFIQMEPRFSGVAFSPNEQFFAHEVSEGKLRLWDFKTKIPLGNFDGYEYGVISLAMSPDGTKLATTGANNTLKIWDLNDDSLLISRDIKFLDRYLAPSRGLDFSPDGTILAVGSADNSIYLWDPTNGTLIRKIEGHNGVIRDIAFSLDGNLLVSAGADSTVRLWDVKTGTALNILKKHTDRVNSVTFSPNGELLVSGSDDGMILLWDVNTGENLSDIKAHFGDELMGIASLETPCDSSPPPTEPLENKPYLIVDPTCGTPSEQIDKEDGTVEVLPGTKIHVEGYNFTPEKEVEIWWKDPAISQFRHREGGNILRIIPDEEGYFETEVTWPYRLIPESHLDGEEIWQLQGRQIISVGDKPFSVYDVSFSRDGRYLVSRGGDGTLKIWGVP